MAVASPVLERKLKSTDEREIKNDIFRSSIMTEEERHNSQISSNYAKLINPESTVNDIVERKEIVREEEQKTPDLNYVPVNETPVQTPYLVRNARADADIFRADSIINKKAEEVNTASTAVVKCEDDEEDEDLRPTPTTIQYKTTGTKKSEEGKIQNVGASKKALTKRDKIVIAAVICVIVALFVLIIVNSAIISNLNSDLNYLQSSLTSVKAAYSGISDEVQEYFLNLPESVKDYAVNNGMVLR